jgi:hypothetical protein
MQFDLGSTSPLPACLPVRFHQRHKIVTAARDRKRKHTTFSCTGASNSISGSRPTPSEGIYDSSQQGGRSLRLGLLHLFAIRVCYGFGYHRRASHPKAR